jgi:putative transposase
MAMSLRVEFPGAIYHVTVRMVGSWAEDRGRLFRGRGDYERLMERLSERVQDFDIRLYLFCLMANHFHLVLETPRGNLVRFMHSLTTAYGTYYNLRHDRYGPVMGR